MHVIPTLLTTSQDEFINQLATFQKYYSRIQLDIADSILVPNKTTQIEEMISLLFTKKASLSLEVTFDFHLMVENFHEELKKIKKMEEMGMIINTVLINAELKPDISKLMSEYGFSIGLDIFPDTKIDTVAQQYNLNAVETIQIMTVNPGFQGSPFLEDMLLKIEQLRILNYKMPIMIDGGVNDVTIPIIKRKKFQPDVICIGSYLTKAGDLLGERVKELNNL